MANEYITAPQYADLAVAALEQDSVLPTAFTRIDGARFKGALDDTLNWKLPAVISARNYEWRSRLNPIQLDEISRVTIPILINEHIYSAVALTDEEDKLDLTSFKTEILDVQVEAVRTRLEEKVVAALNAVDWATSATPFNAAAADDPLEWATSVMQALNAVGTPRANRTILVGANAEAWLLNSDRLNDFNMSGRAGSYAGIEVPTIRGMRVLGSSLLTDNQIFVVHESALVIANCAPNIPAGVVSGSTVRYKGYGLRVIRDYDANFLRDRSVVSTFNGISSVEDHRDANGDLTGENPRGGKGTFTP